MGKIFNKIETSLIVVEKENIFTKFFKWVSNFFVGTKAKMWTQEKEEKVDTEIPNITIPQAVKMPKKVIKTDNLEENSLEYLYKMSDKQLDDLDKLYDSQLQEAQNEIIRLENTLQTYKQSIKKLQNQISSEEA